MLKLLWKALKILLVVILLAGAFFGIYYLVTWKHWPWWVGAAIGLGALGLVMGILFLRKWLFRRREKKFVERVVEQDEALRVRARQEEPRELVDLETRWKEAVAILRRSHLKKHGNPIYVLPWYLFLGDSGSGKTTAIHSARLHSPVTEVSPASVDRPTGNVDWWFFETSIVLDTAGRYTVFQDEVLDKAEWKKFLSLMAKYRRREPINGVVVALPADRLIGDPEDELAEYARTVRRRIDEIMRVGGARFPIWVLVTKADQISGFSTLAEHLPESALDQALGVTNDTSDQRPALFVRKAVSLIAERVKDLRLVLLPQNPSVEPSLLLFPEELAALEARLSHFISSAFEVNPYQETPILRGLFFSSGRQKGVVGSHTLAGAAGAWHRKLPDTGKGLFLGDFISRILPSDSAVMTPLREFLSWKRLTKSMGLLAWLAVILCLMGLVTLSFVKNYQTLTAMEENFTSPPSLNNDLWKNLSVLDKYRNELNEMHRLNQNWWIPRLGYDQSLRVEKVLKQHFCVLFRQGVIQHWDNVLAGRIAEATDQTPGSTIGSTVEHLERRINLINAAMAGADADTLKKMPQLKYDTPVTPERQMLVVLATEFSQLYPSYVDWAQKLAPTDLMDERDWLQSMVVRLTQSQGANLRWLVDWANVHPDLKPVKLAEFWGVRPLGGDEGVMVPAAYTKAGHNQIQDFLKKYEASLQDPNLVKQRLGDFEQWYWQQYLKVWRDFGQGFDQRYLVISDQDEYRSLTTSMGDASNPYFKVLQRMALELAPLEGREKLPEWVHEVFLFKDVQLQSKLENNKKTPASLGDRLKQEALKSEAAVKNVVNQTTGANQQADRLKQTITGAQYYDQYVKALGGTVAVTSSRDEAFKLAQASFTGESGDQDKSHFKEADTAIRLLKKTIETPGADENDLFYRLVSGPYTYLLAYTIHETSCYLQLEWEGDVLAASADLPEEKLQIGLFDDQKGLVWKYVNGPAKAFLERTTQGYQAKKYQGNQFPFKPKFLGFLDKGATQTQLILPQYDVVIEAMPTDVNREADLEPYATVLTLNCDKGAQKLENFNYPSKLTFKWTPSDCGAVALQIKFTDFTLEKQYPGPNGFQDFLDDFQGGSKTFTPADFPRQKDELTGIDVKNVRVVYKITGGDPIRKLLEKQTFQLPQTITECPGL